MGVKLVAYFEKAKKLGGLEAQVKLAILTAFSQALQDFAGSS